MNWSGKSFHFSTFHMSPRWRMKVIHLLRCLKEKYRELNKGLHSVFKYVENAYNNMPPKIIWIFLDDKAVSCMYVMGNGRHVTVCDGQWKICHPKLLSQAATKVAACIWIKHVSFHVFRRTVHLGGGYWMFTNVGFMFKLRRHILNPPKYYLCQIMSLHNLNYVSHMLNYWDCVTQYLNNVLFE